MATPTTYNAQRAVFWVFVPATQVGITGKAHGKTTEHPTRKNEQKYFGEAAVPQVTKGGLIVPERLRCTNLVKSRFQC